MRFVTALFARKSTSLGCWPRRGKKYLPFCGEQPSGRVFMVSQPRPLVSVQPIENLGVAAL